MGVYAGYALFSGNSITFGHKAIRFDTKELVHEFFEIAFPKLTKTIKAVPVITEDTGYYVSVIDILKSGHKEYTETMVDNIPMMTYSIN